MQQVEAYLGYLAPTSYVTNTAGFATADYLRRVTLVAYRTRGLELAHPGAGAGSADRGVWERHEAWQPARKIEKALIADDWGEAFTAFNLVLAPTLDDVLLRQFKEVRDSPWSTARRTTRCCAGGSTGGPRSPTPRQPASAPCGDPARARSQRGGGRVRRPCETGGVPQRDLLGGGREHREGACGTVSGTMTGQWHATLRIDDLWEGEMEGVEVGEEKVLLINVDGEVRAYRNRCPHQAWALDEGDFDGETLTCVRHMWVFDARSGTGVNPDNCRLNSFPCKVDGDGTILVDIG
ncbi:Rieske 2Fe-2S domain-containing protein [Amycolatopsis methanolica]|nr:Rieske 2Fe-2S domain-containing protein [Amycolatopsis methanolica]